MRGINPFSLLCYTRFSLNSRGLHLFIDGRTATRRGIAVIGVEEVLQGVRVDGDWSQ